MTNKLPRVGRVTPAELKDDEWFLLDNFPMNWQRTAQNLKLASDTLMETHRERMQPILAALRATIDGKEIDLSKIGYYGELERSAFLLAGFALENILKALVISVIPNRVQGGQLKFDHELTLLAAEAGIEPDLSADEKQLLAFLTHVIYHIGRYPTPKNKTRSIAGVEFGTHTYEVFSELFSRINASVHPFPATTR